METQVTVEFDDYDVWGAVEDTVRDEITSFIDEHLQEYDHDAIGNSNDGVASGVQELLLEYKNTPKPCGIGIAFEQAVWKAICRLDNPNVEDEWASAAREYLLDRVNNDAPPTEYGTEYGYVRVRAIVREELATVLLSFAKAVDAQLGAEVAVAPGD